MQPFFRHQQLLPQQDRSPDATHAPRQHPLQQGLAHLRWTRGTSQHQNASVLPSPAISPPATAAWVLLPPRSLKSTYASSCQPLLCETLLTIPERCCREWKDVWGSGDRGTSLLGTRLGGSQGG